MKEEFKCTEVKTKYGDYLVFENSKIKCIRSKEYNYNFDKKTGYFERWGKTKEEDPLFSPFGPEILDQEISINGCPNNCPQCYKGNTNKLATNMTFGEYKRILSKFKNTPLCQIALGICGVKTNPDFIRILKYTREQGIVPNFTLSGIDCTEEYIKEISKYIGACAISVYETDKNIGYNTIEKFINAGITQTNIHLVTMKENIDFVYEVLKDIKIDKRLEKLNAIVLLKMKPKGRAKGHFTNLSQNEYNSLFQYCFDNNIPLGMDSCHSRNFELFLQQTNVEEKRKKEIEQSIESCESFGLYSSYINYLGSYFPCSFTEGEEDWKIGIDVINCNNFLEDVWYNNKLVKYREKSINSCYSTGCRKCLTFNIDPD